MFKKDSLNECRILTMSNNRKCDSIIVDYGINSTIVMGIKEVIGCRDSIDIIFIKEILNKEFKELIKDVECICYEFDVDLVITDKNGLGLRFYDYFSNNICSIRIIGIDKLDTNVAIKLKEDIDEFNIRLMQSYECAKKSYKKPFLGYSEIMQIHKETDLLMYELDNLHLELKSGKIK